MNIQSHRCMLLWRGSHVEKFLFNIFLKVCACLRESSKKCNNPIRKMSSKNYTTTPRRIQRKCYPRRKQKKNEADEPYYLAT